MVTFISHSRTTEGCNIYQLKLSKCINKTVRIEIQPIINILLEEESKKFIDVDVSENVSIEVGVAENELIEVGVSVYVLFLQIGHLQPPGSSKKPYFLFFNFLHQEHRQPSFLCSTAMVEWQKAIKGFFAFNILLHK